MTMPCLRLMIVSAALPLFAAVAPDWVEGLGGKVDRDASGEVIALHLRGTWVTDTELLDVARLPKLERLDLSHTRISDEGLLHLKPAKQITDLNLFYAEQVTDQGMIAIRDWKNLKRLNVRGTRVFDGTLAIVSGLTQLESLDIAYTQITDNGLDGLVPLTQLKELSIGRSKLNQGALEVLRLLPTLEYLDLGGPHPGAGGYRAKPGTPLPEQVPQAIAELKQLRVLKLSYSEINADGLRYLVKLDQLEKLSLAGCPHVDDRAMSELAELKSLKYLDVQATEVTPQAVAALEKSKPGILILSGAGPFAVGAPAPQEPRR